MLSAITAPANLHRFRIDIPRSDFGMNGKYSCIVEAAAFPAPGPMREIALWVDGEKVTYPGQPENGGTWTFKIPESDKFEIVKSLDALIEEMYNFETGTGTTRTWRDVTIWSLNLEDKPVAGVKLHGAWMKNRNQVNLNAADASQAWKWDYVMVYNWVGKLEK